MNYEEFSLMDCIIGYSIWGGPTICDGDSKSVYGERE